MLWLFSLVSSATPIVLTPLTVFFHLFSIAAAVALVGVAVAVEVVIVTVVAQ